MGTVRDWWQRLTGRASAAPEPVTTPRPPAPKAAKTSGIELTDPPDAKRPSRVGAAGFDPYSSDAGFAKPHSWERVDHD